VHDLPPLPEAALRLHEWLLGYYPSGSGATTQLFVPSGLARIVRQTKLKPKKKITHNLPPLTAEQQAVLTALDTAGGKTALLHGETDSGKTRIYLERARQAVATGKSALILVPEISLVPQVAGFF